jgi:hypothetical protein
VAVSLSAMSIEHSRSNIQCSSLPDLIYIFGHGNGWPVSVSPRLQHPPDPHPSSWRLPICDCSPCKSMFLFPFHSELVDERRNYCWPSCKARFPLCRSSLILSQILPRPQGTISSSASHAGQQVRLRPVTPPVHLIDPSTKTAKPHVRWRVRCFHEWMLRIGQV